MKLLEWNNLIARHFFNPSHAGKEVHLYITKDDIVSLARPHFAGSPDQEVWKDFINKVKLGLPGSSVHTGIIGKALHSHHEWKKPGIKSIDGVAIEFPLFICYLVFFVLPLVDAQDDYNSNNYYRRLDDFLRDNGIDQDLHNRLRDIDHFWTELADWAISSRNGELGFFRVKNFINARWTYVGKVFSQCVFPPKAVKRLPSLFFKAGMIPDSNYSSAEIKRYLLQYGSSILLLPNNVIDIIRNERNELGQSIVDTAKREYRNWTGESHPGDEAEGVSRNEIFSRLYLQLQIFANTGRVVFTYRMRSTTELPEDLKFNGTEIREERSGFSKTIALPFKDSFQLHDEFNAWTARFPDKEVRLFITAGSFQLSTDYWIETDVLSKVYWMYLLCKNSKKDQIIGWLKSKCQNHEDESDLTGMPPGYSLLKFLNPREGLDDIPELTIIREKRIKLTSALSLDFRTFTNDYLPEVEISNSDGTEDIRLQYKNTDEEIVLTKKSSAGNIWLLPENISLDADFNVRIAGETLQENEKTYKIISAENSTQFLDGKILPKRNSMGQIVTEPVAHYSKGNDVFSSNNVRQIAYLLHFRGTKEAALPQLFAPLYSHTEGNVLLSFLTLCRTLSATEFHSAFELIYMRYLGSQTQTNAGLTFSRIKKASLNYFDYLGYLDYHYLSKTIVVLPPQLILLPAEKGRRALLTGGRDISLVKSMLKAAPKFRLQVEVTRQFVSNEDLLLPDAITISSFGSKNEGYGEKSILDFARELDIAFNPAEFPQVHLQELSADIDTYATELLQQSEASISYEEWAGYIFDVNTLHFEMFQKPQFSKDLALLEYRIRPWEYHHRIWIKQKCYEVDRNWGRYLLLNQFQKNYILFDANSGKAGVPVDTPLPRLLAKSLLLLSGLAPYFKTIEGRHYRIYENIPSEFIQNLFKKLKQKTIATHL
jgi:hypothetical protein